MKYLILLIVLPSLSLAVEIPKSVQLWKKQADYYFSLDLGDEPTFKSMLKKYYKEIYSEQMLKSRNAWIDEGSLYSEHFSSFYDDFNVTVVEKVRQPAKYIYMLETRQSSCYGLGMNSLMLETVVSNYKIMNITQQQFNSWRRSLDPASEAKSEICLNIQRTIEFIVDPSDGLIRSEVWTINNSTAEVHSKK